MVGESMMLLAKAGMIAVEPRFGHAQFPLEGWENQDLREKAPSRHSSTL